MKGIGREGGVRQASKERKRGLERGEASEGRQGSLGRGNEG